MLREKEILSKRHDLPQSCFLRQIRLSGKMRILLILSVLMAGTGTLFLYWYDQAQLACDQISDQCADAGFAW